MIKLKKSSVSNEVPKKHLYMADLFITLPDAVDWINRNHLDQEDIQSIYFDGEYPIILYWAEKAIY